MLFDPARAEPAAPEQRLERLRAELATSRADFRALFEHALGALVITDGVAVLAANEATARLSGLPRERLIGQRLTDFASAVGAAELTRAVREAIAAGRSSGEIELAMPDGRRATVEFASSRFSPDRYVLEVRDITARAEAQAALAASEAAFRAVFEHAADGMFVVDDDGVVVDANLAACRLAERSRPELIGLHVAQLLETAHAVEVDRAIDRLRPGAVQVQTFEVVGPGGEPRRHEAVTVADISPGRNLAVVRDVTARDAQRGDRHRAQPDAEIHTTGAW